MEAPVQGSTHARKTWTRLATLAAIAALLAVAVLALPKGFDTDLGRIGAGRPVLVFVYDPNLVVSNQQTREMDAVRETLGDRLHLLIADIGRPDAQQFMQRHEARPTQLLLFASDGRLLGRMQALVAADRLIAAIEAAGAG